MQKAGIMASTANNAGRVHFWRSPDLKGLETCHVVESRHIFPNHAHENIYAVGLMEKGSSYCMGEEKKELAVRPGQCCLLNPGQVHSGVPVGRQPITYRMLYLDIDLVKSAAEDVQEKEKAYPEFKKIVIRDAHLFPLLMKVCRLNERPGGRLEKESLLLETLGRLLLRIRGHYGCRLSYGVDILGAVQRAKDLMTTNLDQKLTLEEIADSAGLSLVSFFENIQTIDRPFSSSVPDPQASRLGQGSAEEGASGCRGCPGIRICRSKPPHQ